METEILPSNSSWVDVDHIFGPSFAPLSCLTTALLAVLVLYSFRGSKNNVPIINPKKSFEVTVTRAKQEYIHGARKMLNDWFGANPNKPVRVNADFGQVTMLPPHLTNEIRNDDRLSFSRWIRKVRAPLGINVAS